MEVNMLFAKSIHMRVDNKKPTKETHGYFLNGWRCILMVRSLKWKYPHLLTRRPKYKRK
jgi:hypothetical protein